MYSLPITTYSDYWRKTSTLSTYFGGAITLLIGACVWIPEQNKHLHYQEKKIPQVQANIQINKIGAQGLTHQAVSLQDQRVLGFLSQGNMSRGHREPIQTVTSESVITDYQLKEVQIDFHTEYIETSELPPGCSQVKEKGINGSQQQVVKLSKTGTKVDQEIIYSSDLLVPQTEVIERNSKPNIGEKFDLNNLAVVKTYQVEATAYTFTGNLTATGKTPRVGLIAVDPKVIPLGSRLYIEGYGYAIAADTGGDIKGNKIDIFLNSERECVEWGRKKTKLFLLNNATK
ncbi:MAG: 3D domain-containing protein [Desulfitobacteriaceae bacterium]